MTEEEWLACVDPRAMLRWLRGRVSQRKLRLLACACLRTVLHLPDASQACLVLDRRSHAAVAVAERYADGEASAEDLAAARDVARDAEHEAQVANWTNKVAGKEFDEVASDATHLACDLCGLLDADAAEAAVWCVPNTFDRAAGWEAHRVGGDTRGDAWDEIQTRALAAWEARACVLVRHLFGNPFRPIRVPEAWLTWQGGTVRKLAQLAYDERILPAAVLDNVHLAVLADALEEAGCSEHEILAHLRSGEDHYRGCFVLDLLLGKVRTDSAS